MSKSKKNKAPYYKRRFPILVLKTIGILSTIAGAGWFLLPLFRRGFTIGSIFGEFICILGLLLLIFYRAIAKRGGWKKAVLRLITCFYCLGLVWCGYLSGLMYSATWNVPPTQTNVIVLGAQVYSETSVSPSLRGRLDKATEYLGENLAARCIVTGGQGYNEPVTEASVQKRLLIQNGIDSSRIFEEDRSKTTRENMLFAKVIADSENMGQEVAVVTQEFHMFRSLKLAESVGFKPYAVTVKSDPFLLPTYYGRELISLTKWYLEEIFQI